MITNNKKALQDVSLIIVTLCGKPWLECIVTIKAHYQDFCILKALKNHQKDDTAHSKATLHKFISHLWYLSEVTVVLSL